MSKRHKTLERAQAYRRRALDLQKRLDYANLKIDGIEGRIRAALKHLGNIRPKDSDNGRRLQNVIIMLDLIVGGTSFNRALETAFVDGMKKQIAKSPLLGMEE